MGADVHDESPLFLMRLWDEEVESMSSGGNADFGANAPQSRWHGKLLRVTTGEARYFSGWSDLLSILEGMFPESGADGEFAPDHEK